MASMSVKNRVAMFETGKDDENPISPKASWNRRSSAPTGKSFQRPTTPSSPAFGQSFLKPTTPGGNSKPFGKKDVNSPKARSSWPFPVEEDDVIPAPNIVTSSKTNDKRRFSSPRTTPVGSGPVILTQKSPMAKSSAQNTPFILPQKAMNSQSKFEKSPLKKPVQISTMKPDFLSASPVSSENKAPKSNDTATRNKALHLAKSRNSLTSRAKIEQRDDQHSFQMDAELNSINGCTLTSDERDAPSATDMTTTTGSSSQLSRAGKLSQTLRRSSTLEPDRSQSPMPAVRGSMTLSKVSHKEARKALLQAAQRKKEKADAIKEEEKSREEKLATNKVPLADQRIHEDLSKRSEGSAADRLATKAKNVLKIKNSLLFGDVKTKDSYGLEETHRDTEGSCNGSVASSSYRLKTHPAFTARAASPRVSAHIARSAHLMAGGAKTPKADGTPKAFSEELFTSFRHFHEQRPDQKAGAPNKGKSNNFTSRQKSFSTTLSHLIFITILSSVTEAATADKGRPPQPSPMWSKSPRTLKEAMAAGKGTSFHSLENGSPMAGSRTGRYSIDSMENTVEQEESLHSTSEHNFDRKWMDSTGQPRYAPSYQSFQQQEGGYLSSLSGNDFSAVSMISSAQEQKHLSIRAAIEETAQLGDITTPTMRSAHSMAHSIVSITSPPAEATGRKSNEFEYLSVTPSQRAMVNTPQNNAIPSGVPAQIDEEESAGPSAGPSIDAPSEPTIGLLVEGLDNEDLRRNDGVLPVQTSHSAADAPAGFDFYDEDTDGSSDEKNNRHAREPTGHSFDKRDKEEKTEEICVPAKHVEKSSSTKGSVSLRSGLSDVQCDPESKIITSMSPKEGSKSIRSGLSGLQNGSDLEGSASMRSISVSMKSTKMFENDQNESEDKHNTESATAVEAAPQTSVTRPKIETILEADDEEASGMKTLDDEPAIKPEAETPKQPKSQELSQDSDSDHRKPILPANLAVAAKSEKVEEDISVVSSPASSKQSSKWRMKMPNLVKSVLAKASPRHDPMRAPKGQITEMEKTGFSTSEEEDDIFGGLEDELSKVMGEVATKQNQQLPPTSAKSSVIVAKQSTTPRPPPPAANRFFNSSHTRHTEPPPSRINPTAATLQHRSMRSEDRSTPKEKKKTPRGVGLSFKSLKERLTSPRNSGNRTPMTNVSTNDRSGTEVVEQEMENVNSDITSSILGAPIQKKQQANQVQNEEAHEDVLGKTPKAMTGKLLPTSTKSKAKTPKIDNLSVADKSGFSKGKDTLLDGPADADAEETLLDEATRATSAFQEKLNSADDKAEEPASMFMGFGCGLSDAFAVVSKVCHFGKDDDEEPDVKAMDDINTYISADATHNSSSHLTELEKRVWNEWDKLDSAFSKANKTPNADKSKDNHEKKREVARGKLLEIANSAISSQMTKEGEQSAASVSYTSGSSSDSADTGNSSGMTGSSSEGGHTASSSGEESRSYFSGSDAASDQLSASVGSKPSSTTTPILLSFSQRSLIEKFSKQLAHHGVEVLKLNRRSQWQARYFTVSKEQIALIAHEAKTKSGAEVAQCPKALLWLKKFSSKSGGYSLSNIDKNGHGGMMLVGLKDIIVSADHQDLKSPLPKKFADKFKDSVMVALEHEFKGEKRRIEFRCKDNDEAQFLCTCMRVIRDLLKREQTLRLKTQKKSKK